MCQPVARLFLSTLSLRRATFLYFVALKGQEFLSTLSLRRATPSLYQLYDTYAISIHALLAESDDDLEPSTTRKLTFLSTLSLRRATRQNYECFKWIKFLSTLSLRRATPRNWRKPHEQKTFLSTLSLRRATKVYGYGDNKKIISIHALLAESDYGKEVQ